jgi:hypothetical protein
MLIQNRLGSRFEMVVHPASTVAAGVPVPYAGPEAFLATFTASQRSTMLQTLSTYPRFASVDLVTLRHIHDDNTASAFLAGMIRAKHLAFRHPSAPTRTVAPTATGPREPTVKSPPPPPPPVHQEVVCELMAVEASCSHNGRKASRAGLLEVVPGRTDDLIKLTSQMRGGCGQHSRWEVRSPFATPVVKTGVSASFVAKSWGFKLLGIFEVQPKSYYVVCTCCSGPTKQLEVRAYPLDEWECAAPA